MLGRGELGMACRITWTCLSQLEEELGWVRYQEEPEEDAGSAGGPVPPVRCLGSAWGKWRWPRRL